MVFDKPWLIVFLGTGNDYRSRFAEILFNHEAARAKLPWRSISRGLDVGASARGLGIHKEVPMGERYVAKFPNRSLRSEFLEQVSLWNGLEDLPKIEVEALADGTGVRIRGIDWQVRGVRSLVDAFGGRILQSAVASA